MMNVAAMVLGFATFTALGEAWRNYPRKNLEVTIVAEADIFPRDHQPYHRHADCYTMDPLTARMALQEMKIGGEKVRLNEMPLGADVILKNISQVSVHARQRFHATDVGVIHDLERVDGRFRANSLEFLCNEMVKADATTRNAIYSYLP